MIIIDFCRWKCNHPFIEGGTSYLHSIIVGGNTIYESGNPWDGYTTSDGDYIWTISLTTGSVSFYLMTANSGPEGITYPYSGTSARTITSDTTKIEFTTFEEFSIGYSVYSSDGSSTAYTN